MIEQTNKLRAIQSSFMVNKYTTAVQFLFAYGTVTKDRKSEEEIWPMVCLKRQDICSDSPNRMMSLAGSGLKT